VTPQAALTLAITLIAAVLLISEKLRPDLVALLVLASLALTGVVSSGEAFAGFSGSAVMILISISVISEGLRQTGVTNSLGQLMYRLGGGSESKLILVTTLTSATLSLFMNNIAAVGVLLPAVMTLARRGKIAPSRLMMPLAFGTILGGMATLLTTANLILSGALRDAGQHPFGLLDFLPIGLPIVLLGTLYMLTLGRRLMPRRTSSGAGDQLPQQLRESLGRIYRLDRTLHEIEVLPECPLAGRSLAEARWSQAAGLSIISIIRGGQALLAPSANETVHGGDHLLVQGKLAPALLEQFCLKLIPGSRGPQDLTDAGTALVELVVTPHGMLVGKSLQEVDFREKYELNVLAVWREGRAVISELAGLKLKVGDALLVQGTAARLQLLQKDRDLVLLEEDPDAVLKPKRFALALGITLVTLATAAADVFPTAVVIFVGAIVLVITGCLEMNDAYQSIEWKAIFLIAGMWPLSTAIRTSGLAGLTVNGILGITGAATPLLIALALILLALLFTQITGGQVAALILAPLALAAAGNTGADPRALAMAVALGCSLAFPTPFGHPVNIMVMSPGGYTVRDYLRIGLPLTGLIVGVILLGLHFFWGL
jgi:di/tricarboxylate transporter